MTLSGAALKDEKNVIQGMIGALLMISVVGNANVLSEMLETPVPSRNLWQMIFGLVVMVSIFVNHFLISHSRFHNKRRVIIGQLLFVVLILFRCYQIISNFIAGGFTPIMIEVTVGMLAIIPTLNVIICIECRGDGYKF
jgi:hypothetical protein